MLHIAHLSDAGSLPILAAAKAKGKIFFYVILRIFVIIITIIMFKPALPAACSNHHHMILDMAYVHPTNIGPHCCQSPAASPVFAPMLKAVTKSAMLQRGADTLGLRYLWRP